MCYLSVQGEAANVYHSGSTTNAQNPEVAAHGIEDKEKLYRVIHSYHFVYNHTNTFKCIPLSLSNSSWSIGGNKKKKKKKRYSLTINAKATMQVRR